MGLFSKLFGGGEADETAALRALEEFERLAERDSPIEAMEFMASLRGRCSAMLGPNGPLHSRFIACLDKLKKKADDRVYGRVPITDEEMAKIAKAMKRFTR